MKLSDVVCEKIREAVPDASVSADGDGSRMQIHVVSDVFDGLSRVKRQQRVYSAIGEMIREGELHAVTIDALTLAEQDAQS